MRIPFSKQSKLLKKYIAPYKKKMSIIGLLMLLNVALQVINPLIIRFYLDSVKDLASINVLTKAALMFIGIAIVQELLYIVNVFLSVDLAWRSTNDLRYDLMDHCISLDMTFHNKYKPGEMIERVDGDVNALSNFFSVFSLMVLSNIILLIGVLLTLFIERFIFGLAFTLLSLIAIVSMYYVRNLSLKDWKNARQSTSELMGFIEERLGGTEEIRANNGIEHIYKKFHQLSANEFDGYNGAVLRSRVSAVVTFFIMGIGSTIVYLIGVPLVIDRSITPGTLYLLTYYFQLILQPIFEILRQIQQLQQADASIDRINDLFNTKTKLHNIGSKSLITGSVDLLFRDLDFAYSSDNYVLRNINFHLKNGTSMGLIGKTGSGKTTLSRLIYRLYDHNSGSIQINGIDIKEFDLKELRKMIVIVTQQVQLFAATIRENITFFDESIDDKLIMETIDMVGLKDWLNNQKDGLDTKLKKNGLSAGESQLLAFVRAFISNPSIVILDEASSRLDPATEVLIDNAVKKLLHGRTSIIIAHRLETLESVDDIMILDNGKILEYGRRQLLNMDHNSYYSKLREVGIEEMLA